MLSISYDVTVNIQDANGDDVMLDEVYTSSDIKQEAKRNGESFMEVASRYTLFGMDDNGNSYYVDLENV